MSNAFVQKMMQTYQSLPNFFLVVMNRMITRTSAAMNTMLSVMEIIVIGRMKPLSSPGACVATYIHVYMYIYMQTF